MNSKLFGGVLLVIGTTIGAGMLALPVATAQLGFLGSLVLLVSCWGIMTACAFLFLEVNLWLPPNSNLISMAGMTLGKSGQAVAWIFYLLLLYSILSAYIAGGGDLFHYILQTRNIHISSQLAAICFTLLFGFIVYLGIRCVDYVNRGLMFGKMSAFLLLAILILPFITMNHLEGGEFKYLIEPNSVTITIAAFTCLMIIPSLRTYFNDDIKTLRKAIWLGTLIPLICYIVWDMVIMGVIPIKGNPSLTQMLHSNGANSGLVIALSTLLQKHTITTIAKFFTSICMATSFLSISLSLSDFLSDGFRIAKKGIGNTLIYSATFIPPLTMVLFYPDAFIRGIRYAGLCCFVLMIFLPAAMVWRGRYHQARESLYRVKGGRILLALLMIFASLMVGFGLEGTI